MSTRWHTARGKVTRLDEEWHSSNWRPTAGDSVSSEIITDGAGLIAEVESIAESTPIVHAKVEFADDLPDHLVTLSPSQGPRGHRVRTHDRLLDGGIDGLADYDLLEMLLFLVQPRGDNKPLAKRLLKQFGSYANVLAATQASLLTVPGLGRFTVAVLKLVHGSAIRLARAEVLEKPILGNWDQLMAYLNAVMARERVEQFRILFLDTKNRLIADELQGRGTINHTPVYPREVTRRAFELHAASLILVHNHPSGDPTPSMADLDMTMQIQKILLSLGMMLHDHIVVGNGKWTSLRKEGFI